MRKFVDLLLNTEAFWVLPILIYAYWFLALTAPGQEYIPLICIILCCTPFFLRKWKRGYFTVRSRFEIPITLFFAGSVIGLVISIETYVSLRAFMSLLICIIGYYTIVNYQYSKKLLVSLLVIIFVSSFIGPFFALAEHGTSEGFGFLNNIGSWFHAMIESLPDLPTPSTHITPVIRWTWGIMIPAFITTAVLAGVVLFGNRTRIKIISLLFFILIVVIIILVGGQGFIRLVSGETLRSRLDLWQDAIEALWANPIAGLGLGLPLLFEYGIYRSKFEHPHNSYLEIYGNAGILGIIAMIVWLLAFIKLSKEILPKLKTKPWFGFWLGLFIAILAMMFLGFFTNVMSGFMIKTTSGYYYLISIVPWWLGACIVVAGEIVKYDSVVYS